eukprot:SM000169S02705  [mRNA]  locus=s169:16353:36740:- [translate_table: standard]
MPAPTAGAAPPAPAVQLATAAALAHFCRVALLEASSPGQLQANAAIQSSAAAGLARLFAWLGPHLTSPRTGADGKALLLSALQDLLSLPQHAARVVLEKHTEGVFAACRVLLDDEATPIVLVPPVLATLSVLASNFQHSFEAHFEDVVDLMLGWALEPSLPDTESQLISRALVDLAPLWGRMPKSGFVLLSKFLEDMKVLTDRVAAGTGTGEGLEGRKLVSLSACFSSVLQGISRGRQSKEQDETRAGSDGGDVQPLAKELLAKVVELCAAPGSRAWQAQACTSLEALAELLGEDLGTLFLSISRFMSDALNQARASSSQLAMLLQSLLHICRCTGAGTTLEAVDWLLNTGGHLSRLRLHNNQKVVAAVANLYIYLALHPSPDVRRVACQKLQQEIMDFSTCLERDNHRMPGNLPAHAEQLTDADLVLLVHFNLLILVLGVDQLPASASVTNLDESSHPTVPGLEPEALQWLAADVDITGEPFASQPELQQAVLEGLRLLTIAVVKKSSGSSRVPAADIAGLCDGPGDPEDIHLVSCNKDSELLLAASQPQASVGLKLEMLCWMACAGSMQSQAGGDGAQMQIGQGMAAALLGAMRDEEDVVRSKAATTVQALAQSGFLPVVALHSIAEVALQQLGDRCEELQVLFKRVMEAVAPSALWLCGWTGRAHLEDTSSSLWSWRQDSLQRLQPIKRVLEVLLDGISSRNHKLAASDWMHVRIEDSLLPVEAVERGMYVASEGSEPCHAEPLEATRLFFRKKKKLCNDWLARIRDMLLHISLAVQSYASVFWHATARLCDLKTDFAAAVREGEIASTSIPAIFRQDVQHVLRHACLALTRLGFPHHITGLQAWASETFSMVWGCSNSPSMVEPLAWMTIAHIQAQQKHEESIELCSQLLTSEVAISSLDADSIQYCIASTIDNYTALADWEGLEAWLANLQSLRVKSVGKEFAGALTTAGIDMNPILALARFDCGDYSAASAALALTPQSNTELTPDTSQALLRSHQDNDPGAAAAEFALARAMLDEPISSAAGFSSISECAPLILQLESIRIAEDADSDRGKSFATAYWLNLLGVSMSEWDASSHCISPWFNMLRVLKRRSGGSEIIKALQRQLIRVGRKQGNVNFAKRLLKQLDKEVEVPSATAEGNHLDLRLFEGIKLQLAEGQQSEALHDLLSLCKPSLFDEKQQAQKAGPPKDLVKVALRFSSLLEVIKEGDSASADYNFFDSAATASKLCFESLKGLEEGSAIADLNQLQGRTLTKATELSATSSKAWFALGAWSDNHAKALLTSGAATKKERHGLLFGEEHNHIKLLLTEAYTDALGQEADLTGLTSLINTISSLLLRAALSAGSQKHTQEAVVSGLRASLHMELLQTGLQKAAARLVEELLMTWQQMRRQILAPIKQSAAAYIQYLSLEHSGQAVGRRASSARSTSMESRSWRHWQALLRVLEMFLNYGAELDEAFRDYFVSVPTSVWKGIYPQLLASVSSHPEAAIRGQLLSTLEELLDILPSAGLYSVVVAYNLASGRPSLELQHLMDFLLGKHPKVVHDVQILIAQLGSITQLWDEKWLQLLLALSPDVQRRLATLKQEEADALQKKTAICDIWQKLGVKYNYLMKPMILALETCIRETSVPPATLHEKWFQETYGENLRQAAASFSRPPDGPSALRKAWKPWEAIATSLAESQRGAVLSLQKVAPELAKMRSAAAPMPGLDAEYSQEIITWEAMEDKIVQLATKTRPKKLSSLGSDGIWRPYLLKGSEDLRLDARVMQLLRAVNGMLQSGKSTRHLAFSARTYSVVPISGRAGLIEWVTGMTSLYSVFKSWQQRTYAAQLAAHAQAAASTDASPPQPPQRPMDMYHGKIISVLKERGMRRSTPRQDWPQDVKKQVLVELMQEMPKHLIARQLWCSSSGPPAWMAKQQRYTESMAVMSMAGHMIGLGDRHMDNILLDFGSGSIMHIDYNICFDKGLRLKIPEIVPFRLTQLLQAALGLTGIDGSFRVYCNVVVEELRKNQGSILIMLQVFVWDPLIEWMSEQGQDNAALTEEEEVKGMGNEHVLEVLVSRVIDMRASFQEHNDQLFRALPEASAVLQALLHELGDGVGQSGTASDPVKSAAVLMAQNSLREAAETASKWVERHTAVLEGLRLRNISWLQHAPQATDLFAISLCLSAWGDLIPASRLHHMEEMDAALFKMDQACYMAMLQLHDFLSAYATALRLLLTDDYASTSSSWSSTLTLTATVSTLQACMAEVNAIQSRVQDVLLPEVAKAAASGDLSMEHFLIEFMEIQKTVTRACAEARTVALTEKAMAHRQLDELDKKELHDQKTKLSSKLVRAEQLFMDLASLSLLEGAESISRWGRVLLAALSDVFAGLQAADLILPETTAASPAHPGAGPGESPWIQAPFLGRRASFFSGKMCFIAAILEPCLLAITARRAGTPDTTYQQLQQQLLYKSHHLLNSYLLTRLLPDLDLCTLPNGAPAVQAWMLSCDSLALQDVFAVEGLEEAKKLVLDWPRSWEAVELKSSMANDIDVLVTNTKAALRHVQTQLACFQWLHEGSLPRDCLVKVSLEDFALTETQGFHLGSIAWWKRGQLLESMRRAVEETMLALAAARDLAQQSLALLEEEIIKPAEDGVRAAVSGLQSVIDRIRRIVLSRQEHGRGLIRLAAVVQSFEACREGALLKGGQLQTLTWQEANMKLLLQLDKALTSNPSGGVGNVSLTTTTTTAREVCALGDLLRLQLALSTDLRPLLEELSVIISKEGHSQDASCVRQALQEQGRLVSLLDQAKALLEPVEALAKAGGFSESSGQPVAEAAAFLAQASPQIAAAAREVLVTLDQLSHFNTLETMPLQLLKASPPVPFTVDELASDISHDRGSREGTGSPMVLKMLQDIAGRGASSRTSGLSHGKASLEEPETTDSERQALKADRHGGGSRASPTSWSVAAESPAPQAPSLQEHNLEAELVLSRVQKKLEGYDNTTNKRLEVAEQVDMLIQEATSLDNLSQMYEGWTPWL